RLGCGFETPSRHAALRHPEPMKMWADIYTSDQVRLIFRAETTASIRARVAFRIAKTAPHFHGFWVPHRGMTTWFAWRGGGGFFVGGVCLQNKPSNRRQAQQTLSDCLITNPQADVHGVHPQTRNTNSTPSAAASPRSGARSCRP